MGAGLGSDKSMPLGHGDCQPAKLLAVPEKTENRPEHDTQRRVGYCGKFGRAMAQGQLDHAACYHLEKPAVGVIGNLAQRIKQLHHGPHLRIGHQW
jgi:hypothetical protein